MSEAERIRSWLQQALADSGMSIAELSEKAGVHKATIFRALSPDYGYVPSSRTMAKLAETLQARRDLSAGDIGDYRAQPLHTPYELSPTTWLDESEPHQDIAGSSQIVPIAGVPARFQWVGRMRGDSMSPTYEDGDDLHIVQIAALKTAFQPGDHVVLQRRRHETGGLQISARAVLQADGDHFTLGFTSNAPRWRGEIQLNGLTDTTDGVEHMIVGLVVGMYRTRPIWR